MPPTNKEIEALTDHLDKISSQMKQVLFYLHNDDNTNRKGLVQEVSDLKIELYGVKDELAEFIHEHKKEKAIRNAKVGVIAALSGAGASFFGWLVMLWLKLKS